MNERSKWLYRLDQATRTAAVPSQPTMGTPVDAPTASAVVDLALRVSELALAAGSSTADATSYALTVADSFGLQVDVDVTWTAITISYHRSGVWEPITGFRSVRERQNDYQLLANLDAFVDQVVEGKMRLVEARDRFRELRTQARPYRPWVLALASGALGLNVALMLGGGWAEALMAGFAMVVLFAGVRGLERTGLAPFYLQVVGAIIPTALALVIMALKPNVYWLSDISPSMVVAAGMVSLLAGLGVVTAARDALEGNLVTSAARTFDTVLKTGGIVFGVVLALWVGLRVGVPGSIAPMGAFASLAWWQAICAGFASVAFAISSQVAPRALAACGLLGLAGYATYIVVSPVIENAPASSTAAAFVVGILASVVSKPWRVPALALVTTGVVSLMPGMMLYRGLYYLIDNADDASSALVPQLLLDAALTGIGLAAGSMLGSQLISPVAKRAAGWKWRVHSD